MPPGFEFEDRNKVGRVNQRFVFGPFSGVEIALVCPLTEHLDPCLHRLIDAERNQTSSRFRVQAEAQRFQKAVKPGNRIHALTLTQPMQPWRQGDCRQRVASGKAFLEVELLSNFGANHPKQPQNNRFFASPGNFPRINSDPLPVS